MLVGFSWSAAARFSATAKLNAASQGLVSHLRQLQAHAIARHQTQPLNYGQSLLPAGLSFVSCPAISFASSGFTAFGGSGTVIIKNRLGATKKIVVSTVGRVRIE